MEKSITSVQSQARLSFASHEAQRLATGGKAHFRLKVKRLRTLTLSALLMTAATGAWAQDKLTVLTVDDITVANGEETEIVINLDYNASQNMAGVNFSLYLPDGLLLKGFDTKQAQDAGKASALKKACDLGDDGVWGEDASSGWLAVKHKTDGGLLFTLIDQDDKTPFESTNAKLVTVHVHAVANIVNGEGLISTIGLKNENNESVEEGNLADVKFYVNKATAPAEPTEPFVGTVSLNDGTQNPATWTAKAGDATEFSALPLAPTGNTVDLSTLTANYEAQNGDVLTGSISTYCVTIADGATVTLDGATISGSSYCIKCAGSATIILKDGTTNTLTSTSPDYPALWAGDDGTTLTIQGSTGALTVQSGTCCAGIGGGYHNTNNTCGNIRIEGGVITATGGSYGAGIGSDGGPAHCGNIEITGGTVTATGGINAAGIGTGEGDEHEASCGNITITNGVTKVTAKKGAYAPNSIGKGGGDNASCGTVTIEPGANVIQN